MHSKREHQGLSFSVNGVVIKPKRSQDLSGIFKPARDPFWNMGVRTDGDQFTSHFSVPGQYLGQGVKIRQSLCERGSIDLQSYTPADQLAENGVDQTGEGPVSIKIVSFRKISGYIIQMTA